MRNFILFLGMILFLASLCFAQGSQPEEISITTYYPSPFGSYNELQTNKMAVGDINGDGQLTYADEPANNGDLAVAGNVGIGTGNPQGKLDLRGPLAVNGSVGTSGQVLESQGSGATPMWTTSGPVSTGLYGFCQQWFTGVALAPAYHNPGPPISCACQIGYQLVLTGAQPVSGYSIYSCYKN